MNIKELRDKTNLSQRAFGKILGLSPQSILNYEAGKNVPETVKKLIRYEFSEYLPENERLHPKEDKPLKDPDFQYQKEGSSGTVAENQRLQQRVAELENDKKMLTNYIKSLEHQLGINGDDKQTA